MITCTVEVIMIKKGKDKFAIQLLRLLKYISGKTDFKFFFYKS